MNGPVDVNCYGLTKCPKCGKRYRWVCNRDPQTVRCDDCGYKEPLSAENSYDVWRDAEQGP